MRWTASVAWGAVCDPGGTEPRGIVPADGSAPKPVRKYNRAVPSVAAGAVASECRQCCSFCDRVVLPSGCAGCPYLYAYDDEATHRRFMGCLAKVFRVEIDVELFAQGERTRLGFGGMKMTGTPRPQCAIAVDRAYEGVGGPFECVNPSFFDHPEPDPDAAAFDLRNRL